MNKHIKQFLISLILLLYVSTLINMDVVLNSDGIKKNSIIQTIFNIQHKLKGLI